MFSQHNDTCTFRIFLLSLARSGHRHTVPLSFCLCSVHASMSSISYRSQQRDYSRIYSFNLKSATKHPIGQQQPHQWHKNIWKHFLFERKNRRYGKWRMKKTKKKKTKRQQQRKTETETTSAAPAAAYFCGTETGFSARSLFSCLLIVSIYQ